jgi:4-coumarate--CoA ligase
MHTGDIGRIDEKGRLILTDRKKELIKYKGYQVPPAELEAILISMKEVKDAIVIPVPDEEGGEVPRAYVVLQDGITAPDQVTEQQVIDFVYDRVAPHKRLRGGVRFTDVIPRSPAGKLLRRVQIQQDRDMK